MRQAGERDLIERRRGYLRKLYASRGLATIMGRRCAAKHGGFREMAREHPALDWLPINRNRRPFRGRLSAELVPIDGFDDDNDLIVPGRATRYVMGRTALGV